MKILIILGACFLLLLSGCQDTISENDNSNIVIADTNSQLEGDSIIRMAIEAHGGVKYDEARYEFVFRDKVYQFVNFGDQFFYTREQVVDSDTILDLLSNEGFERLINSKISKTNKIEDSKYSESINSVIYFATLPHKLNDKAVIKNFKGQIKIKDADYNVVEVMFTAEGGGTDHDDIFYYWFNVETSQIDYLAYQYATNGGGIRFRSAFNKREINGIIFQDYINYSAVVGTPLKELPKLFEQEGLVMLSLIETEKVSVLPF